MGRAIPRLPMPVGLDVSALLALCVSAWAGLAPFIGPSFGYDPAGSSTLHWDLARAVLTVAPAIVGVVGALCVLASVGAWRHRGRSGPLALGAVLVLLAGAWFALGTFAWMPLEHVRYVSSGGPLSGFAAMVGIAVGPGLVLCALGGAIVGWQAGSPRLDAVAAAETSEVREVPAPSSVTTPAATPLVTQDSDPIV